MSWLKSVQKQKAPLTDFAMSRATIVVDGLSVDS